MSWVELPGVKISRHAQLLEPGDVVVGDDAAAEHSDVRGLLLPEQVDHRGEQRHVRAGHDGQPIASTSSWTAALTIISGVWCSPV